MPLVQSVKDVARFADLYSRGVRRRGRRLCVVHGNCQAEPLRACLDGQPAFRAAYTTIRIPPVHAISAHQARLLRRLMPRVDLLVTQPVRDRYRGLPVGDGELEAAMGSHGRVVRFPSLYFEGFYPYQVYVGKGGGENLLTPEIGYHDLRWLHAGAQGWSTAESLRWISTFRTSGSAVQRNADRSMRMLRERERETDIKVSDLVADQMAAGEVGFYTVNHPRRAVLDEVTLQILTHLGLESSPQTDHRGEFFDAYRSPIERPIIDALGLEVDEQPTWVIGGAERPLEDHLAEHLAWYRANSSAITIGLEQHGERMAELGIPVG